MLKSGASYIAFAVGNKVGDAPGVGHDRQRGVGPGCGRKRPAVDDKQARDLMGLAPLVQHRSHFRVSRGCHCGVLIGKGGSLL
jgi:hypothetical protein